MIEKIKEIIAGYMGIQVSEISEEKSFTDMGMDSLTLLKIIIDVESHFGVSFENDEIVEIRTAIDIFEQVEKKLF